MESSSKVHLNDTLLFKQVAKVIGKRNTLIELGKVWRHRTEANFTYTDGLMSAFGWMYTPQGAQFWNNIDEGINPYGEHHEH